MRQTIKRLLFTAVLCLCCFPATTFAISWADDFEYMFILNASRRTAEPTTYYILEESDEPGGLPRKVVAGTLPAKLFYNRSSLPKTDPIVQLGLQEIHYYLNGSVNTAYIDADSPTLPTTDRITLSNGEVATVCAYDSEDRDRLLQTLMRYYPGATFSFPTADNHYVIIETGAPGEQPTETPAAADSPASTAKPAAKPTAQRKAAAAPTITPFVELIPLTARYQETEVEVIELGVASCVVRAGEEETMIVPTRALTFSESVAPEQAVAVILAPRTGKCTLRAQGNAQAAALRQCSAGIVVAVLETGAEFCKISYQNQQGYVLTACLSFQGGKDAALGDGAISYNGKTDGANHITVRNTMSGDSAAVGKWPTGSTVSVFALKDGWYEVELDGVHGYVPKRFLTQ